MRDPRSPSMDRPSWSPRQHYWYSYGFTSRDAADDEIEALYASGEICPADDPIVVKYHNTDGAARYGVKLLED